MKRIIHDLPQETAAMACLRTIFSPARSGIRIA